MSLVSDFVLTVIKEVVRNPPPKNLPIIRHYNWMVLVQAVGEQTPRAEAGRGVVKCSSHRA